MKNKINKKMNDNQEILKKLYYNPSIEFNSVSKFYKKLKEKSYEISLKKVKEFINKQLTKQFTKQIKKPKIFNTINSYKIKDNY